MKIVLIACSILLLLAVANLPIGYYTFLRIAVTGCALFCISREIKFGLNIWVILFSCLAILFNPILPVYLYEKSIWSPLDIASAVIFLLYSFKNKS